MTMTATIVHFRQGAGTVQCAGYALNNALQRDVIDCGSYFGDKGWAAGKLNQEANKLGLGLRFVNLVPPVHVGAREDDGTPPGGTIEPLLDRNKSSVLFVELRQYHTGDGKIKEHRGAINSHAVAVHRGLWIDSLGDDFVDLHDVDMNSLPVIPIGDKEYWPHVSGIWAYEIVPLNDGDPEENFDPWSDDDRKEKRAKRAKRKSGSKTAGKGKKPKAASNRSRTARKKKLPRQRSRKGQLKNGSRW